ncbi:endo-alpha-N-acetylgalactosaminidase family protein [Lacinutrix jangbogonensis]|uniref:endo-alpha-N-acetylgalactosaminidase family protein n=1 Tax=Lacinutrix jangbogonensis TaxID=1469557 RepID=UPI00068957DC|nr:endo-alpha-N-acetylgalactosaminidase family protein [Lacinutrix jangbogonensis]
MRALYTSILCCCISLTTLAQKVTQLQSNALSVTVDKTFPRIINYQWKASGAVMSANKNQLSSMLINGDSYSPIVRAKTENNKILYTLSITELDLEIKLHISVLKNIVSLKFDTIIENGVFKVHTIEFPNHSLLSVKSTDKNGQFSGSKMFTAVKGTGDIFQKITKKTPVDSIAKGYLYAIVNTRNLAGAIWSNAVQEKTDSMRLQKQTIKQSGLKTTKVWSGSWIYRAKGMIKPSPLPELKIVITNDVNKDNQVDWQDGAIAYRDILNTLVGSEKIPNMVVQRIPMNFASQATNPFSKSLEETKRIFLNTDGLGQYVILKGYGSEGHDSKHPDYADIGHRQGGAEELNVLANAAKKYNTSIGVHINGTESYPEAQAFNETLIDKKRKGWNWLDQSYYMDKRYDGVSGNRLRRIKALKDQVPALDFLYVDVWYAKGSWDSRQLGREIHSLGLYYTTEFPQDHEYDAIWNHWAVDYKYGGKTIKGYNSKIVRFIRNHQKDTWIAKHPLLGGTEMVDFEGWQGRINYDDCINVTFDINLPTKYLQHFPIKKWEEKSIIFTDGIKVSIDSGERIITKNNNVLLKGNMYLLPWNPRTEEKLYHWNDNGGSSSWQLPTSWKSVSTVYVYQLTDLGKMNEEEISVVNNQVELSAKPKIPYVIYKKKQQKETMVWGEGSLVKNMGFNSGDLDRWKLNGANTAVKRNENGQYELSIDKGEKVSVSQTLKRLPKGHYYASVYVNTQNRKATLEVKTKNKSTSKYALNSLWENYIAADSKHGANMQRMYVHFDVEAHHEDVELVLKADKGSGKVLFDNIRVKAIAQTKKADSLYFVENFEHVPSGIFPFVKGPAGGANDPRIHLAELHAPYTQKGWSGKKVDDVIEGKWSLKLHENVNGLVVQTIPQNVGFEAGKKYTVTFKYQTESNDYSFAIGDNTEIISENVIAAQLETQTYSVTFMGSKSGNTWIGFVKNNKKESDLIIDNIEIKEHKTNNWTITESSSEEASGEGPNNGHAKHAIDFNSDTYWHSAWNDSQPSYPHYLEVNLNKEQVIKGFTFLNRKAKYNGRPKDITIETSADGSIFQSLGNFKLGDGSKKQVIQWPTPLTIKYFKIIITSVYDDHSGEDVFFTHLAEVGVTE